LNSLMMMISWTNFQMIGESV